MNSLSVVFDRVVKRYGATYALASFEAAIEPGEFVTLLGPSGSGKSTALNILAGFTEATSGRVLIGGRDVTGEPPETRNLGMVFQSFALFPHMNVAENVAFPMKMRGWDRKRIGRRVGEVLGLVHLDAYSRRRPHALSGGQKQRVALARALAAEPPVLLMDECLSALDLKLRESLQIEIKRLHRSLGTTILFVTHDQGEAMSMSDRIIVMRSGAIEQIGTPRDIYENPETQFVAEFIGSTNLIQVSRDGDTGVIGSQRFSWPEAWPEETVSLSVRSEVFGAADTSGVVLPAKVSETFYLGEVFQLVAESQDAGPLLVRAPRGSPLWQARPGDLIDLTFSPFDATALTRRHQDQSKTNREADI